MTLTLRMDAGEWVNRMRNAIALAHRDLGFVDELLGRSLGPAHESPARYSDLR